MCALNKYIKKQKQRSVHNSNQFLLWKIKKRKLTMISAITLGCLSGLQRKAMNLVKATTKHIWTINNGSAKSIGFSCWKAPLDMAFIGCGHVVGSGVAIFNSINFN